MTAPRLGGPNHNPVIVASLVFSECRAESCDHDECPTHEGIVCVACIELDEIGLGASAPEWPCEHVAAEEVGE